MADDRKVSPADAAREEIGKFSRSALGYDWPADPGAPRPRDAIEWVREQQRKQKARQKYVGALVLAALSAIGSTIVTTGWPWLMQLLGR